MSIPTDPTETFRDKLLSVAKGAGIAAAGAALAYLSGQGALGAAVAAVVVNVVRKFWPDVASLFTGSTK